MMYFWAKLNQKLAEARMPEAVFSEVLFYMDHGMSVQEAVNDQLKKYV